MLVTVLRWLMLYSCYL